MKRFIQTSGCLYVCFAILVAYSAAGARQAAVAHNQDRGTDVASNSGRADATLGMVRGTYSETARVIVYTVQGCYGCEVFKRDGIPALIAEGIVVEVIDANVDPPADKTIKTFPTIIVFDGTELQRWVGPAPVQDILAAIPQQQEPPEYRIWDFRRWWN